MYLPWFILWKKLLLLKKFQAEDMRIVVETVIGENCEPALQKVHLLVERVNSGDVFQLVRQNKTRLTLLNRQIETGIYILKKHSFSSQDKNIKREEKWH